MIMCRWLFLLHQHLLCYFTAFVRSDRPAKFPNLRINVSCIVAYYDNNVLSGIYSINFTVHVAKN